MTRSGGVSVGGVVGQFGSQGSPVSVVVGVPESVGSVSVGDSVGDLVGDFDGDFVVFVGLTVRVVGGGVYGA